MNAIVRTRYGSPDVLQYTDVERRAPKNNEVLIRVRAASLKAIPGTRRLRFGCRGTCLLIGQTGFRS